VQVVYVTGDAERELTLRINHPEATIGDVLDALPGSDQADGLLIDGRFCHSELGVAESGLHEGAVIAPARRDHPHAAEPTPSFELRVIAGSDAGRTHTVAGERLVIGRDHVCDVTIDDPSVSRQHCEIRVLPGSPPILEDLGSANGTLVEGRRIAGEHHLRPGEVVEVGDVAFVLADVAREDVVPIDPVRQVGPGGTIPFNRPPRSITKLEDVQLNIPEQPREPVKAPFSIAALVGPLAMGAVMVVITRNVTFALFMVLSPMMLVFNWYETRRRNRSTSRRGQREYRERLAEFQESLGTQSAARTESARRTYPDAAEVVRRSLAPSRALWERRPGHQDFLHLQAGYGDLPWRPTFGGARETGPEVARALESHAKLRVFPVDVDISQGGVVGVVGPREASLAVARNLLCQASVLHGPADLAVAVLVDAGRGYDWDWTKWLPHTRDIEARGDARLLTEGLEESRALVQELLRRKPADGASARVTLAVIDSEELTAGRASPARSLLRGAGGPSAGIVLAPSAEQLPAVCTVVVDVTRGLGDAGVSRPMLGEQVESFLAAGMTQDTARRCARALSRFEDPELEAAGAGLPDAVGLLPLLELPKLDAETLLAAWQRGDVERRLASPIGVSEEGTFVLDWVSDGPHGLIGGTTGAGKSELLRTIVAGLAAAYDPAHLNFVLVDYKGGSAFGECARLPHTVGMVTDLDEQLGERALRSLEAELRYREAVLRDHGASDLPDYIAQTAHESDAPSLPRLLVIIDEFATLASELPDFIASLVGIAQRGRSLGVHMLLATQRPSGAVNENIKANTNLRISLRMQSASESGDVIGTPDAAKISRSQPGRAYVRLGPGEIVPIQTALVTGLSAAEGIAAVEAAEFGYGRSHQATSVAGPEASERSDLDRLVEVIEDAFEMQGSPRPRRPWLEPLPAEVPLQEIVTQRVDRSLLGIAQDVVAFALADDPERQAQYAVGWDVAAGNLLLYGIVGSGTTSTLATLAVSIASTRSPDDAHIYALDFGAGELKPLEGLPHVGAVVVASESERVARLIRRLRSELDRRRQLDSATRAREPRIFLLVDNYGALASEHSDIAGLELIDALQRVYADGPELGVHVAVAADRIGAVPQALGSLTQQRLAFRMSDPGEYGYFGLRGTQVPRPAPGRCVAAGSARVMQVGWVGPDLAEAVSRIAAGQPAPDRAPLAVGVLPESVAVQEIAGAARLGSYPWFVPVGIGSSTLEPAGFELYEAEHALIAGPARSGKTTALILIAELARAVGVNVYAIAGRRSALGEVVASAARGPEEVPGLCQSVAAAPAACVLLIDDCHTVDDADGSLKQLVESGRSDLHVIAAGRPDSLRGLYGHWTQSVRRSHVGLLLMPNIDLDADLLGAALPRRQTVAIGPGRGYVVSGGEVELVQVALPVPAVPSVGTASAAQ
jgi:S-DNA-T family DNA segregation ATPase FtsK/SpoIIIE